MFAIRLLSACLALTIASAIASPAAAREAPIYRFDPVHSQVVFFVSHLGFADGIGRVRLAPGTFRFDADDWSRSSVDVAIDLTTLDMGDAQWTDAVLHRQLLHAEKYPQARFRSLSTTKTGERDGIVHGELTLHGTTRPLDLAVTFNKAGRDPYAFKDKVGFSARATLDRGDFGIDRYQGVVGETVELRIEIEGIRERASTSSGPSPASGASDATEEH